MKFINTSKAIAGVFLTVVATFQVVQVQADTYQVSITNVTRGQSFTPRLAATHTDGNFFVVGEPALPPVSA